MEGKAFCVARKFGIDINEERLVQALTDAKKFYEEGYVDGSNSFHRHGRWIVDGYFNYASCSFCGKCAPDKGYDDNEPLLSRYCPHCGTKMDGRENVNDGT